VVYVKLRHRVRQRPQRILGSGVHCIPVNLVVLAGMFELPILLEVIRTYLDQASVFGLRFRHLETGHSAGLQIPPVRRMEAIWSRSAMMAEALSMIQPAGQCLCLWTPHKVILCRPLSSNNFKD
jgi:hypothetical protein